MEFNKPVYVMSISASGSPFEIRLNDCPVLSSKTDGNIQVKMPVNKWMKEGLNTIHIWELRPPEGESQVALYMFVKDMDQSVPATPPLCPMELLAPAKTEENQEDWLQAEDSFEVKEKLPFGPWRWEATETIALTDEDKKNISKTAQDFRSALQKQDMERIKSLVSLKTQEICQAHYQTEEERLSQMEHQYRMLGDSSEWKLEAWNEQNIAAKLYAHGRLVLLQDVTTNDSPFVFTSLDETTVTQIEMFFFQDQDKIWKIIR